MPLLDCKTYDKNNLQQAALPPVRRNYTAKPIDNRMLIYNVRREVAKVRCVADGGPAGSQAIEQNIRVDCKYLHRSVWSSMAHIFLKIAR